MNVFFLRYFRGEQPISLLNADVNALSDLYRVKAQSSRRLLEKLVARQGFDPATEEATFRLAASDSLARLYGPAFAHDMRKAPD